GAPAQPRLVRFIAPVIGHVGRAAYRSAPAAPDVLRPLPGSALGQACLPRLSGNRSDLPTWPARWTRRWPPCRSAPAVSPSDLAAEPTPPCWPYTPPCMRGATALTCIVS